MCECIWLHIIALFWVNRIFMMKKPTNWTRYYGWIAAVFKNRMVVVGLDVVSWHGAVSGEKMEQQLQVCYWILLAFCFCCGTMRRIHLHLRPRLHQGKNKVSSSSSTNIITTPHLFSFTGLFVFNSCFFTDVSCFLSRLKIWKKGIVPWRIASGPMVPIINHKKMNL